ncbi:hypothetical protein BRC68_04600 [Halobacteriales archaeon QH_6_64_20]|nr:MAG: hypothetical protein BRC68_04600 [Halobacteriales archaeon QH_6_64_20]
MTVLWLDDVRKEDIDAVGGKGASLGELKAANLPVPPGFVVGAESYRSFIEETGIDTELFDAVDVDPEDSAALADAESRARDLILSTEMPAELSEEIDPTQQMVKFAGCAAMVGREALRSGSDMWYLNLDSTDHN